jgi:predicted nucleic acid-binding protein
MGDQPFVCVVDANVVLKLYQQQLGSDQAAALFARLAVDGLASCYVPDLLYAECANAFAQYVRILGQAASTAQRDMARLQALALHSIPTADLATQALDIALKHRVSGYDACYVALAARVRAPLITADEKLVRHLAGQEYRVHSLVTFVIPQ